MKCADIRDILLADFADDELSTDKKALVDRHLDACPSCREVLKAVRAVDAQFVISEVPVLPPEEIWDNIRQQIEARPVSPLEKVAAWWEDMLRGWASNICLWKLCFGVDRSSGGGSSFSCHGAAGWRFVGYRHLGHCVFGRRNIVLQSWGCRERYEC